MSQLQEEKNTTPISGPLRTSESLPHIFQAQDGCWYSIGGASKDDKFLLPDAIPQNIPNFFVRKVMWIPWTRSNESFLLLRNASYQRTLYDRASLLLHDRVKMLELEILNIQWWLILELKFVLQPWCQHRSRRISATAAISEGLFTVSLLSLHATLSNPHVRSFSNDERALMVPGSALHSFKALHRLNFKGRGYVERESRLSTLHQKQ